MTVRTFSARTFADSWTSQFTAAVTQAAGKDGRLSQTEAAALAQRTDGSQIFADDAQAFFAQSGQKSVAVSKLVALTSSQLAKESTAAAGTDGRLSLADAQKLSAQFRDDFLALRQVQSSGADRPAAELQADVRVEALRAFDSNTAKKLDAAPALKGALPLQTGVAHDPSGTTFDTYAVNGQIYAQRSGSADASLNGWYQVGAVPPRGTGRADLRAQVDSATNGLDLMSESDAKVRFVLGENIGNQPITDALVRSQLGAAHDALGPTIFGYQSSDFVKLADRTTEERDPKAFLDQMVNNADPNDPWSVAQGQQWSQLRDLLEKNLTDLHMYRFGTTSITVMIVGRTKNGDLAGVMSGQVET